MMATADADLLANVTDVVCEELSIDKADATPDANVQELGADTLDLVEFIMRLEEELDVEIPEEMAVKITTVQEAANAQFTAWVISAAFYISSLTSILITKLG